MLTLYQKTFLHSIKVTTFLNRLQVFYEAFRQKFLPDKHPDNLCHFFHHIARSHMQWMDDQADSYCYNIVTAPSNMVNSTNSLNKLLVTDYEMIRRENAHGRVWSVGNMIIPIAGAVFFPEGSTMTF